MTLSRNIELLSEYVKTKAVEFAQPVKWLTEHIKNSNDQPLLHSLNFNIRKNLDENRKIEMFFGDEINELSLNKRSQIAQCYKEVFNDSWKEDWNLGSAFEEVTRQLTSNKFQEPVLVLHYFKEQIVGLCIANYLIDNEHLNEFIYSSSTAEINSTAASDLKFWLEKIVNKSLIMNIKELAILKGYRANVTPYLLIPILEKALSRNYEVICMWTPPASNAFKWALGVGCTPIQIHPRHNRVLMCGHIRYVASILNNSIDDRTKMSTQIEVLKNIRRYLG